MHGLPRQRGSRGAPEHDHGVVGPRRAGAAETPRAGARVAVGRLPAPGDLSVAWIGAMVFVLLFQVSVAVVLLSMGWNFSSF